MKEKAVTCAYEVGWTERHRCTRRVVGASFPQWLHAFLRHWNTHNSFYAYTHGALSFFAPAFLRAEMRISAIVFSLACSIRASGTHIRVSFNRSNGMYVFYGALNFHQNSDPFFSAQEASRYWQSFHFDSCLTLVQDYRSFRNVRNAPPNQRGSQRYYLDQTPRTRCRHPK